MQTEGGLEELERHGVRKVRLAGTDLDGVLRGKYVSVEKLASAVRKGFGFCNVIFAWDVEDRTYDFDTFTGWSTGYPDTLARVDPDTLRLLPDEPQTALFLCDFWEAPETPLPVCPRNLLKRIIRRGEALGFHARASVEYEFWIFRESPASLQEKGFQALAPLSPGSFGYSGLRAAQNGALVHEILDRCAEAKVELEGLHTETGPGVYEAAIAVQDVLEAADRAAIFKTLVKEIAHRHGCTATFMAKWSADRAGSSGHLHLSLWDSGGSNRFQGSGAEMGAFVAGQLALMPELTALYCPTINSYRRLVPGFWAPTSATWGLENRTTALRTIPGTHPGAARVENRLAGADANPYLALAAALASGLYGIEQGLTPPPPVAGSGYHADGVPLPKTLDEATALLSRSEAARELLGSAFVDHFAASRDWEVRRFREAVTDWELRRYFEII
ncbi:MAG: glutamine synthetase family protein [Armatimonadota bacterium]